jgi:peptide/nickel transport system substrate-binding protein
MRYTKGNDIRKNECELFAATAKQLGVTVNVQITDSLGKTLAHKDAQHDYDIVVFAWVGTPFPASGNHDAYVTDGGNNFGLYSNKQVDQWLDDSVSNLDPSAVIDDMNKADEQISKDAYTLPLYQKPTYLVFSNKYGNLRDNPTSVGPSYNINEWGLKAS